MTDKLLAEALKDIEFEGTLIKAGDVGLVEGEVEDNLVVYFIRTKKEIVCPREDVRTFGDNEVGDGLSKKVCNVCHRSLETTDFVKNQNAKDNRAVRRPSCRECRKIIDGKKLSSKDKKEWEARRPFMVHFTCPICEKVTIAGVTSKIVLDHDHKTGAPRDWLCDSCNTGLGRFKDDIGILERAIAFLKKSR